METLLLAPEEVGRAAEIIRRGGIVAMPTETVYGLAGNALDGGTVKKIFEAKGRPADNPLIVHISDISQIYGLVRVFPEKAKILAEKFWPGPLTIILPKSDKIPDEVSAGLDTVAIRYPSHPLAQKLISLSMPLAAPSANLSGSPSPTTMRHVMDDMNGRIDAVLDGGECEVGVESTVISLAGDVPVVLRPGGITVEMLRNTIGEVEIASAVINPLAEGEKAESPGMKYKHYSPKADVVLVDGNDEEFISFVNSQMGQKLAVICYEEDKDLITAERIVVGKKGDYSAFAHNLFSALRRADELGCNIVYSRCPETAGMGLAVYNRIVRAAGFDIHLLVNSGKEGVQ